MANVEKSLADKIVATAKKQVEAGLLFRQPRMNRIQQIEAMYALEEKPALAGKYNIPFDGVIMRGFVDSLMAKIDEPPRLDFRNTKEAAYKAAKKIKAAAQYELSSTRTNLNQKDRWGKKLAIISGRAIFKVWGESNPFNFNVRNVDHYDFVTEPNGGGNLDDHLYRYQLNIFRTREEVKDSAGDRYDNGQVEQLINKTTAKDTKETQDAYNNKLARFNALGLDPVSNNYVGQELYALTEGTLMYGGEKYYLVFDYNSGIWLRCEPLKDVFESELDPWVSWATDDDPFNFWNVGPADVILPVAEGRRINLNAMLNNARKISDDMIVYDQKAITDPSQLIYAPDRLIAAITREGQSLQDLVHRLAPRDITALAMNLDKFLNEFLGQHSGITPGAQGNATENLATIYEGNLQQVQDRIGLLNRSYAEAHERIGRLFDWALWEHATEEYMVKIVGEKGVEWEKLTKEDKDPDFEVMAVGARAEMQSSAQKAQKQKDALTLLMSNPALVSQLNPRKTVEEILRFGEYSDEEIRVFMDTQNEGSQEILAEAARIIQDTLEGKPYKPFRGATTGFVQKIIDYAANNNLEDAMYFKLMAIAEEHLSIAMENEARKVAKMQAQAAPGQAQGAPMPPMNGQQPAPTEAPNPEVALPQ